MRGTRRAAFPNDGRVRRWVGAAAGIRGTLEACQIASQEAQKQLDRIVALGYPDVADMSAAAFRALARPLIHALEHTDLGSNILLIPTARAGCRLSR